MEIYLLHKEKELKHLPILWKRLQVLGTFPQSFPAVFMSFLARFCLLCLYLCVATLKTFKTK